MNKSDNDTWFLYLIECQTPDHYYVGISTAPHERRRRHEGGYGAKFTQIHGVKTFELLTTYPSLAEALKAEYNLTKDLREMEGLIVAGACWTQVQWPQVKTSQSSGRPRADPQNGRRAEGT